MTNLPYIVASYVLFATLALTLAIATVLRLRRAAARLRILDKRDGGRRAAAPGDAA